MLWIILCFLFPIIITIIYYVFEHKASRDTFKTCIYSSLIFFASLMLAFIAYLACAFTIVEKTPSNYETTLSIDHSLTVNSLSYANDKETVLVMNVTDLDGKSYDIDCRSIVFVDDMIGKGSKINIEKRISTNFMHFAPGEVLFVFVI